MAPRLSKAAFDGMYRSLGRLLKEGGADPERGALLGEAFATLDPHLCARAARVVREARVAGFDDAMVRAYERLFTKKDPGCQAKLALAEALDFVDHPSEAPFRRGVGHVQKVAPDEDAGAPLRVRCGLALVRLRVPDALTVLCDLLVDDVAFVRSGAARGLGFHGDARGAALLRLKLHAGDSEPDVTADALAAYVGLEPEAGLEFARGLLETGTSAVREGAALALGESRVEAALPLLIDFVGAAVRERDLRVGLVAILTLRTEAGERYLAEAAAGPDELRARVAREVLGND